MKTLFTLTLLLTSISSFASNKMVIGTDDRIQIDGKNKTEIHESIGLLFSQDSKGVTTTCTGTIIAPKVVITAAHCVEDPFTDIYFVPGQTSKFWGVLNKKTKNAVKAKEVHIFDGYRESDALTTDVAIILFETDFKARPLSLSTQHSTLEFVSIAGYPDDKPRGTLWEDSGMLDGASYTIDTYGGQSGSAVRNKNGEVIGIHSYANYGKRKNFACLLTANHIQFIEKFIE